MKSCLIIVLLSFMMLGVSFQVEAASPKAVSTFQSIGLYWKPGKGSQKTVCTVQYRKSGSSRWNEGLDLWFDNRNKEYRGSLVYLDPGTKYEIKLSLKGTSTTASLTAKTWDENFPIGKTIELPTSSNKTLKIKNSGNKNGYILYTHKAKQKAEIDVKKKQDFNIHIDASYIIIRGLTLKNAKIDGIRLSASAHHIVIEENDITGWGRTTKASEGGYGENHDAAIGLPGWKENPKVTNLVIQRNKLYKPATDSNNWNECNPAHPCDCKGRKPGQQHSSILCHPAGPEAIFLWGTGGNHVIRYNDIYSDDKHMFNDGIAGGQNFSATGFPNADSDIYGNSISHCWDNAIESEGGNRNVRIYGNFLTKTNQSIAVAATHHGPVYVFRNVSGSSYTRPGVGQAHLRME